MFGSRKALLKQSSYIARGESVPGLYTLGTRPQDAMPGNGDRVQVSPHLQPSLSCSKSECRRPDLHFTCFPERLATQAALLAASTDREAAQAALAEAKMRQDETAEVLHLLMQTQYARYI